MGDKSYIGLLNDFHLWLESNALPASSELLYFKLLNIFNRAGWPEYVQVDNQRLAILARVKTENSAISARDKLVEAGFIRYERGKKNFPNRYFLAFHCNIYSESYSEKDSESCSEKDGESYSHIKTKTKNKNTPPTPPRGKGVVSTPKYQPEWFERFYALYPRKTARAAAVKAWDKLKPGRELCDVMAAAIRAQMKTEQWKDPQHIPHPSTWLNGARWLDEVKEGEDENDWYR